MTGERPAHHRLCRSRSLPVRAVAGDAMTHARLGHLARWTCPDCFAQQRPGSYPCSHCTGWTGRRAKVATGVTDAVGRPSRRVPE